MLLAAIGVTTTDLQRDSFANCRRDRLRRNARRARPLAKEG